MTDERLVRYAVVGAGNIAQVAVLPAFAHAKANSRLVAVISGDPDKRTALAEHYDLELTGDYDEFATVLDRGAIDAVYIATPSAVHKELALEAAARGVHVLCEKPLALRAAECREIAATCRSAGVKLMVAYRLHFDPATLHAVEVARSGELGALRLFSSFFSHVVRPDDVRREPSLGGGATYDLGVYCVNAARHLFGAEPTSVFAISIERLGTDDSTTVMLQFPGGCLAQFCVANSTAHVSSYRVAGTEGDLRVEPGFDFTRDRVHHLTVGGRTRRTVFRKSDQFAPELLHFSDCILQGREPEPSGEDAYCDVRVLEAIVESARTHDAVALAPYPYSGHLESSLAAELPPVARQATVHAPGPSIR